MNVFYRFEMQHLTCLAFVWESVGAEKPTVSWHLHDTRSFLHAQ